MQIIIIYNGKQLTTNDKRLKLYERVQNTLKNMQHFEKNLVFTDTKAFKSALFIQKRSELYECAVG